VRWPNGLVETFDAKVDAINPVKEGAGKAAAVRNGVKYNAARTVK
jgi:hypothetical protein